ncbi:MAG: hypothetical protein WA191_04055, partial [Telluria sp.]
FDSTSRLTMRHRTVHFRSSSQYVPDTFDDVFSTVAHDHAFFFLNAAALGGLKPAPASRLREANYHL